MSSSTHVVIDEKNQPAIAVLARVLMVDHKQDVATVVARLGGSEVNRTIFVDGVHEHRGFVDGHIAFGERANAVVFNDALLAILNEEDLSLGKAVLIPRNHFLALQAPS